MSKEAVIQFLDRITSDDALRELVSRSLEERGRDFGAVLEVARGLGLEFSPTELDEALSERYGSPPRELDAAELEAVAGGVMPLATPRWITTKKPGGIAIAFPDVVKTPSPGGPVPIPYPNIGTVKQ